MHHVAGTYKAELKFFFVKFPDIKMTVRITSVVEECRFDVITFSESHIKHGFLIGSDSVTFDAPPLKLVPNCGYLPLISYYYLLPIDLPVGFN